MTRPTTRSTPRPTTRLTGAALFTLLLAGPALANNHQLIYDPTDGSLTIDTLDSTIWNYVIVSPDAFRAENHQRFLGGTPTWTAGTLNGSNPFAPQSGEFEIGNVLPVGLSEQEFNDVITLATYSAVYSDPIIVEDFDLIYIPEPSTLAFALGGLVLLTRRRSASRAC